MVVFFFVFSFELYHRKKDRFEEETKRQLVGNIVLTRLDVDNKFTLLNGLTYIIKFSTSDNAILVL